MAEKIERKLLAHYKARIRARLPLTRNGQREPFFFALR